MAAGEGERDSSTWYTLMEDNDQDKTGRRMTMPSTSSSSAVRTSTFSTPSASSTSAVVAEETATPPPDLSRGSETAKTGILRQSTFTDGNISSDESTPKRRVRKQVSITLPGSTRPLSNLPSENGRGLSAIEEDAGSSDDSGPHEVVVEIDVHEETETTDGENTSC